MNVWEQIHDEVRVAEPEVRRPAKRENNAGAIIGTCMKIGGFIGIFVGVFSAGPGRAAGKVGGFLGMLAGGAIGFVVGCVLAGLAALAE
jgi:hypothetical protein